MKISVSARQSLDILQQAEEIMINYRDKDILLDYEDKGLQDKDIVIAINVATDDVDFDFLDMVNEKFNLTVSITHLSLVNELNLHNIKFYWHYPIQTYYDLNAILSLGASQVLLDTPLTFDLSRVYARIKTGLMHPEGPQIRMVANKAYPNYMVHTSGICGSFMRPEDIDAYEEYIDILQFDSDTLSQERQLFEIYHNDKCWPGNLNILIKNLNVDVDNRAIPPSWLLRMNCKQKCQETGACHLCYNIIDYVNNVDKAKFKWDLETHSWKQ